MTEDEIRQIAKLIYEFTEGQDRRETWAHLDESAQHNFCKVVEIIAPEFKRILGQPPS